jgi:hypothetical protein
MHCGFLSLEVLGTLGFRMVIPHGVGMLANPVGVDGVRPDACRLDRLSVARKNLLPEVGESLAPWPEALGAYQKAEIEKW